MKGGGDSHSKIVYHLISNSHPPIPYPLSHAFTITDHKAGLHILPASTALYSGLMMWSFSFRDRVFDIAGEDFKVVKQLTEEDDEELGQRKVQAIAKRLDQKYLLKIRYQLDPKDCDLDDPKEILEFSEQDFCHEAELTQLLSTHGYGPRYHNHETQNQPEWMPFPGGYLEFIVMDFPPGENVDEIQFDLTDRQRKSIRTKLANLLE